MSFFTILKDNNLPPNEVHIWLARLSTGLNQQDNRYAYWHSCLSPDEKERANQIRFKDDHNQFIAARGILRCLLASYLEESPQDIHFAYGLMGKPCLADLYSTDAKTKTIYFNLSHSKDYACYAFSSQYEVGVDIEYLQHDIKIEEFVPEVLSTNTYQLLADMPISDRVRAFFKMWVSHEALLKAKGTGWLNDYTAIIPQLHNFKSNFLHYFDTEPEYTGALSVIMDDTKRDYFMEDLAIRQFQYDL